MVARTAANRQTAPRTEASTPTAAPRQQIRRVARSRYLHVRTAILHGVLLLARTDAELWEQPVAVMREKLTSPEQPNLVSTEPR